jgi:hypothetical protein
MAVYQVETENGVYEVETEEQAQPEKMVGGVFGKVPESAYQAGERNILGNVFERPGAAIRSALQGKGYTAGAVNPTNVPTFQDLAIKASQQTTSPVANAALGMIPSALGLAADVVTNPADALTAIIPMAKPVQAAGRAIASTKAGKALTELATMPVEQIGRPTAEQLGMKVSKTVKEGIEKAVRPSVIGKRTANQQEAYFKKAESAVKDVLDNKANLEIIDKDGSLVVGKNPESLNEALQAVGQTREGIFETYSPMIKKASAEGATVDGNAIASKLRSFASQENVQLSNPALAKYADDIATRWEGKQVTLDVAEQTAKDFNAMLKQKYQQGKVSGADVSSAHVDDMVVRMLRNEIADKAGVGDLKKRYGALAELEGDLAKRAIVSGRQNKVGLVDSIASIESGADIAGAVAMSAFTGNPMWLGLAVRGIGAKAAGNIIRGINSPDANIARMFKNVEKLRAIPTRSIPAGRAASAIPRAAEVIEQGGAVVPMSKIKVKGSGEVKTPIPRRKGALNNKGQAILPGGKKPTDFATAEEYVASKQTKLDDLGKMNIENIKTSNFSNVINERGNLELWHGSSKKNIKAIKGSGVIKNFGWFAPDKETALKFARQAGGSPDIINVEVSPNDVVFNGNYFTSQKESIPYIKPTGKSQLTAEFNAAKGKKALGIAGATAIGAGLASNANAEMPSDDDAINAILGEVGPYGKEGMQWVASTIRNRNNGLKGVYGAKNPNVIDKKYTKKQYDEAKQAWEESKKKDFTGGAKNWFSDADLKQDKVQNIIKKDKLVFIKRVGKNNFYKKSTPIKKRGE